MQAEEFNARYPVGSCFIYQPCGVLSGRLVKTLDVARDLKSVTMIEISVKPYFTTVKSLTPVSVKLV